jgi:hypothetical protein
MTHTTCTGRDAPRLNIHARVLYLYTHVRNCMVFLYQVSYPWLVLKAKADQQPLSTSSSRTLSPVFLCALITSNQLADRHTTFECLTIIRHTTCTSHFPTISNVHRGHAHLPMWDWHHHRVVWYSVLKIRVVTNNRNISAVVTAILAERKKVWHQQFSIYVSTWIVATSNVKCCIRTNHEHKIGAADKCCKRHFLY